jgi:hypothetical protein
MEILTSKMILDPTKMLKRESVVRMDSVEKRVPEI